MIRAFFAIPLSGSIERQLITGVDSLRKMTEQFNDIESIRWIPPKNYHITLAFLGNIQSRDVERLHELALEVIEETRQFSLGRNALRLNGSIRFSPIDWFPSALNPRLLAVVAEPCDELTRLHMILCKALSREGFQLRKSEFKPHITLARVKNVEKPVDLSSRSLSTDCNMEELVLFSSQLSPKGSLYRPLFAEALGYRLA